MFLYYKILRWFHNEWLKNQPVKYEGLKLICKWNKRAVDEESCFIKFIEIEN